MVDTNDLGQLRQHVDMAFTGGRAFPLSHEDLGELRGVLGALIDIAEAAHRSVEAWAGMQRPAHPDSGVPFMEMMRAVDDMDLGLNRLETI